MSKYEEWLEKDALVRIESWASDGLTNEQIAENMGISRTTFYNWQNKSIDILNALKKGREPVVRHLENALIKKALGFEYEETEELIEKDDNGKKKIKKVIHKKYSVPDSSSLMFLLKNYKPEKYRKYNELTERKMVAETEKLKVEAQKIKLELENSENAEDKTSMFLDNVMELLRNEE